MWTAKDGKEAWKARPQSMGCQGASEWGSGRKPDFGGPGEGQGLGPEVCARGAVAEQVRHVQRPPELCGLRPGGGATKCTSAGSLHALLAAGKAGFSPS